MRSLLPVIIATQLLTSGLMNGGLIGQLICLPGLIEHYEFHKVISGGEMSVSEFLWEHYVEEGNHQHSGNQHTSLPFSSYQLHFQLTPMWLPEPTSQQVASLESSSFFLFNQSLDLVVANGDIFHPPAC